MLTTVFDKSFIHGVTTEEATVFDMHFMTNLTPLFFVEVLADLEKSGMNERGRIGLVRDLASKTPSMHSYLNMSHTDLAIGEMLGQPIQMRGVPVIAGGRRVQSPEGLGTVFEPSREMRATQRWQQGQFGPDEYALARHWRDMLLRAPESISEFLGGSAQRFTFQSLEKVKAFAERVIDGDGRRYHTLRSALVALGVPENFHGDVVARWKQAGGPRLADFAAFVRHVLLVDIFRTLAMASGLMNPDKTSNFADVAYLYYLPFCQVFISSDKLHRKCAPLFLREDQQFVWGHDLRPHLTSLTKEYLESPDLAEVGLYKLSGRKRFSPESFIGGILERGGSKPRKHDGDVSDRLTPEAERALVEKLKAVANSPPPSPDVDLAKEDTSTTFKRSIPRMRGRFPMMPKEIKGGQ